MAHRRRGRGAFRLRVGAAALWAVGCGLAAGCGGNPDRVAVSGQVLIDGEPLRYGQIVFIPPQGRPSRADIDAEGRFALSSFDPRDGAALGVHQIAVFANEQLNQQDTRWHAPKKYSNHRTSGLTQEISGPTDSVVVNLSWEGGKPFVETDKYVEEINKGN